MKKQRPNASNSNTHAAWPPSPGWHSVAVRLSASGKERVVVGEGVISLDPELGEVFQITFPSGGEKLLVATAGGIEAPQSGATLGCEYLICLN